jgi:hypothetical protein
VNLADVWWWYVIRFGLSAVWLVALVMWLTWLLARAAGEAGREPFFRVEAHVVAPPFLPPLLRFAQSGSPQRRCSTPPGRRLRERRP